METLGARTGVLRLGDVLKLCARDDALRFGDCGPPFVGLAVKLVVRNGTVRLGDDNTPLLLTLRAFRRLGVRTGERGGLKLLMDCCCSSTLLCKLGARTESAR